MPRPSHRPTFETLEARCVPALLPADLPVADLNGANGFRINGTVDEGWSGFSVSDAGDVNGDGYDDLIVGSPRLAYRDGTLGYSHVVFGRRGGFPADLNLSDLNGMSGFRIVGLSTFDRMGYSVSGAGDVNGDGYDDLVIGAPNANQSYVVFGRSDFAVELSLSDLNGANGFRVIGPFLSLGHSVSGAGDVNGDGFDDVVIGTKPTRSSASRGFVIFGHSGPFTADLNPGDLNGSNGFRLNDAGSGYYLACSVSEAGDVNGDGFDDVMLGAPIVRTGDAMACQAYIVFGHGGAFEDLDLSALNGMNGFRLNGIADHSHAGFLVSGAGDVNGDGFDDVIIGGQYVDSDGAHGQAFVVFGHSGHFADEFNLNQLSGSNGFRIDDVADRDYTGHSVSGAGDINGDGFDDLIIGAPGVDFGGLAYVVLGHDGGFGTNLDLRALNGSNGFRISPIADDQLGSSVSGAGDINGDGLDDLILGAPLANLRRGQACVVFGRGEVCPQPDTTPPIARLVAVSAFPTAQPNYTFYISFSDNQQIDISSLGDGDLLVTGPNGFSQPAVFRGISEWWGSPAEPVAEYQFTAPGGSWDYTDNGTYTISMVANEVFDTAGLSVAARPMWTVVIELPPPSAPAPPIIVTGTDHGVPHLRVFEADGTLRWEKVAFENHKRGGVRVAVGDVNGDTIPDVIAAPGPGIRAEVKVFNGADGSPLDSLPTLFPYGARFRKGLFVAATDLDGNGTAEIIVGPGSTRLPVRVYDHNGAQVRAFFAYGKGYRGGVRVAAGPALPGGATAIVTAADRGRWEPAWNSRRTANHHFVELGTVVKVFDTQARLQRQLRAAPGASVAVGDVDGDGQAEVIVGAAGRHAAQVRWFDVTPADPVQEGHLTAYAGKSFKGDVRVAVLPRSDVAGRVDILTVPGKGNAAAVKRLDAVTRNELDTFFAYEPAFLGGAFVAGG